MTSRRLLLALGLGTLLNPLNSSMVAVALLQFHDAFEVPLVTTTWVVSAFYIAACVGQPLMGKLGDRFGPRRLFIIGLSLVAATSLAAPFAQNFSWLILARVVLALGTSVAYPSTVAIIHRASRNTDTIPAGALGTISIANTVSAAVGPALGGLLVSFGGWQAIFVVNVPVALSAIILAALWVPPDSVPEYKPTTSLFRSVDLPGIMLFAISIVSSLFVLLSIRTGIVLWPLAIAAPAGIGFVLVEIYTRHPFLDLRVLLVGGRLSSVYIQFIIANIVYYGAFYGLPQWLEYARGLQPHTAGLLLLPTAALGALLTPVVAIIIRKRGVRPTLITGSLALVLGSASILLLGDASPIVVVPLVATIMGVPNGFNNLGLQAAMYASAPESQIGVASGLFQTSRYIGAILATCMLAIFLGERPTSAGLHDVSVIMVALSAILVIVTVMTQRPRHSHVTQSRTGHVTKEFP